MWKSRMRFPSLASARRHLQASQAASKLVKVGGWYCSSFASTAQAILASLLAKATATTLLWARPASCASHSFRPGACLERAQRQPLPQGHAVRRNEKWSMDFVAQRLPDGRWIRVLTVVDQFTRECLTLH